jgi:colicin import membrane protein
MAGEVMTDAAKLDAILKGLNDAAEERKADRARMDSMEKGMKADRERMDAYCGKMDAAEKERMDFNKKEAERMDAERKEKERMDSEAADKAKADAEAKAKADAEAKRILDAAAAEGTELAKLRGELSTLSRLVPAQVTPEIRQRLVGFQSKAERVAQAFGDSAGAPTFVNGESERDYRIRLLAKYQSHSKAYKDADLAKVGDETVFTAIEDAIYSDALNEATNPAVLKAGVLIPQKIKDGAGREITKYIGQDGACWDKFNPPIRHVRRILSPGSARVQ